MNDFNYYMEQARKINKEQKEPTEPLSSEGFNEEVDETTFKKYEDNDIVKEKPIMESVKLKAGLFIKKSPTAKKQFKIESVTGGKIKLEGIKKKYDEDEFFSKYDKNTLSGSEENE